MASPNRTAEYLPVESFATLLSDSANTAANRISPTGSGPRPPRSSRHRPPFGEAPSRSSDSGTASATSIEEEGWNRSSWFTATGAGETLDDGSGHPSEDRRGDAQFQRGEGRGWGVYHQAHHEPGYGAHTSGNEGPANGPRHLSEARGIPQSRLIGSRRGRARASPR